MFKDTDKTIFVGRREDGTIYGTWTVRQWEGHEEKLIDDPEVVAYINRQPRKASEPKPTSKPIDPRLMKVASKGSSSISDERVDDSAAQ